MRRWADINYTLYYDGELVAAVKCKGMFNARFRAKYDAKEIKISARNVKQRGLVEIIDSDSNLIGTIPNMLSMPPLTLLVGEESYFIEYKGKYEKVFIGKTGRSIAISRYDYDSVEASFEILDIRESDPNPWLLAIIGLFIGVHFSGTYP